MSSAQPELQRLFLALWPDESIRARIAELAAKVAGKRAVAMANLHLTLVFLGATDSERLQGYRQALAGLTVPSITLDLDQLGYWSKPHILWLGPSQTPQALIWLVQDLNKRLAACGYQPERRPFRAHITLARKVPKPDELLTFTPLIWHVNRVALVESVSRDGGVCYRVLQSS